MNLDKKTAAYACAVIIFLAVIALFMMGRNPISTTGEVWLFSNSIKSEHNSQHIMDPYSFTHISHGFLFYFLLWLLFSKIGVFGGKVNLWGKWIIAVLIESVWEIIENTDYVIELYRAATISLGYFGDSVLNSFSDICMMLIGFYLASRLPTWVTIVLAITLEVLLLIFIRDNLFLNILMLLIPIQAIKAWQMAGFT